jgi:hypothetical protein
MRSDMPHPIAAVPTDMNLSLHLNMADDAALYFRQIYDIVEKLESNSMTILAFSSFVLYVLQRTISSPLES